ncbi:aldehyde dehydrogenase [Rhodococcus gordoniae]|uniref:Aldehyde dehydrogenase n=1 Tax=Rhodococcus gordoniae TaxID=223392 RepID=A0A379LVW8_9NOCA|nr:aldehyde dehydrogenase [Rhodococcus gordoniae]
MTHDIATSAPPGATDPDRLFTSVDPRDGTTLGQYRITGAAEVAATVERARSAARWWDEIGFRGRRDVLLEFKKAIAGEADSLASLISAETGKPHDDGFIEVMLTVEHLDWAARNASKVLGPGAFPPPCRR